MSRPRPLDVLYEDADFVAVLKPAGVPVHGGAKVKVSSVVQRLPGHRPVHRLDVGTSGVLLLAKHAEAAGRAAQAWPQAVKHYWAGVVGCPGDRVLDAPLRDGEGRVQSARTEIRTEGQSPDARYAWVHAAIHTGRTHQIRRHLAQAGHPVLMDDKHGDFAANKAFRQAVREAGAPNPKHPLLHAHRLEVLQLTLVAPPPARWQAWFGAVHVEPRPGDHGPD